MKGIREVIELAFFLVLFGSAPIMLWCLAPSLVTVLCEIVGVAFSACCLVLTVCVAYWAFKTFSF